jgi:Ankyrin repeats (3 copies)
MVVSSLFLPSLILNLTLAAEHDYVPKQSQASALVLAARNDLAVILSTLIDRGARVAQLDCFERTPLFYAARNGNTSALTSLLKKSLPTNDGSLHEAARELRSDAVKMLVDAGHDINFPSLKHGGRSPLCELCYNCRGSDNSVGLQDTLSQIMAANATPLRKYRGKTPLFFAMENENPMPVVFKLIEVCLWQDLNDPSNVVEEDSHFYSATMYIKKGICAQPENTAKQVLTVLQDASAEDRYYAKERMQQPQDAIGMPQRIADLDHKKWIRSNRLEEEQEDHQRRLRREMEEMSQRDQLTAKRHLLTMEHREDTAKQTTSHTSDAHWQGMQIRSIEHVQATRFKDDLYTHRLDEVAATHRLKYRLDQEVRGAQLHHESETNEQKLGYLGREQNLKFGGAQAQQQLRLEGISTEHSLKNIQQMDELSFREERGNIERADMDYRLQHTMDMSADKVQTQGRLEDVARGSQQRKNVLDHESRQSQLGYQEASDDRRLRTEGGMNQFRRDNNDDTIRTRNALGQIETRTLHDRHEALEHDRQNQFRFSVANDRQKLDTLSNTGRIQNETLQHRHELLQDDRQNQFNFNVSSDQQKLETLRSTGRIQNDTLSERGQIEHKNLHGKNQLLQENRNNELQSTRNMGHQRILNERGMGQQRLQNETSLGQRRILNERGMGQQKIQNERGMGQQRIQNERGMGRQRIQNQHGLGRAKVGTERALGGARAHNAQMMNGLHRQKLMDDYQARRHMNNLGHPTHGRHIQ